MGREDDQRAKTCPLCHCDDGLFLRLFMSEVTEVTEIEIKVGVF